MGPFQRSHFNLDYLRPLFLITVTFEVLGFRTSTYEVGGREHQRHKSAHNIEMQTLKSQSLFIGLHEHFF